jgi:hypothetical protein
VQPSSTRPRNSRGRLQTSGRLGDATSHKASASLEFAVVFAKRNDSFRLLSDETVCSEPENESRLVSTPNVNFISAMRARLQWMFSFITTCTRRNTWNWEVRPRGRALPRAGVLISMMPTMVGRVSAERIGSRTFPRLINVRRNHGPTQAAGLELDAVYELSQYSA